MTPPAAPEKKKRPGLFFLVGCAGCGFLLLLIGVGGTMGWMLWQQNRGGARDQLPVAWQDTLRAMYRLSPLVDRFATVPTEPGDAAAMLAVSPLDDIGTEAHRAVRHLLATAALTHEDSAVIRSATTGAIGAAAELASRAARQSRYEPVLATDSAQRFLQPLGRALRMEGWRRVSPAVSALTLRGESRRWRGDLVGARQDFAAVIALGRLAWRHEVTSQGPYAGRRVIVSGAAGLANIARQKHDVALAAAADSLRAWGAEQLSVYRILESLTPDSLLLLAQDTLLPRGVRVSALENLCWGSIYRPYWRLVTGPSAPLIAGARALSRDPDPVVAQTAERAERTLLRLDDMGIRNRYRVASGKSVR